MKKNYISLLFLALMVLLAGCSDKNSTVQTELTSDFNVTSIQTASSSVTTTISPKFNTATHFRPQVPLPQPSIPASNSIEKRIVQLVQRDDIFLQAYKSDKGLNVKHEPIYGSVHEVNEAYFPDYDTLKEYLKDTYIAKESDRLLSGGKNGKPRYFKYEGKFCTDISDNYGFYLGIDPNNFLYDYSKIDDETYDLTITFITGIRGGQTREPYEIKTKLIMEDGFWKLEKMLLE